MSIKKSLLAVALTAVAAFGVSAAAQEEKSKPQVLFTNVNIFDGKTDRLAEGMSVLVEGNLIKKVAKGDIEADENATVIDGGGRTLMPGLIDSHVHLTHMILEGSLTAWEAATWEEIGAITAAAAREFLKSGFTTVRDMGGMGGGFKRVIDQGDIVGPRIYPAGGLYIANIGTRGSAAEQPAQVGEPDSGRNGAIQQCPLLALSGHLSRL